GTSALARRAQRAGPTRRSSELVERYRGRARPEPPRRAAGPRRLTGRSFRGAPALTAPAPRASRRIPHGHPCARGAPREPLRRPIRLARIADVEAGSREERARKWFGEGAADLRRSGEAILTRFKNLVDGALDEVQGTHPPIGDVMSRNVRTCRDDDTLD